MIPQHEALEKIISEKKKTKKTLVLNTVHPVYSYLTMPMTVLERDRQRQGEIRQTDRHKKRKNYEGGGRKEVRGWGRLKMELSWLNSF